MDKFKGKFKEDLARLFPCVSMQVTLHKAWEGDYVVTLQRDDFQCMSVAVTKKGFLVEYDLATIRAECVKLVLYRALILTYRSLYNDYDWLVIAGELGIVDVSRVDSVVATEVIAQWTSDALRLQRLVGDALYGSMLDELRAKGVLKP